MYLSYPCCWSEICRLVSSICFASDMSRSPHRLKMDFALAAMESMTRPMLDSDFSTQSNTFSAPPAEPPA